MAYLNPKGTYAKIIGSPGGAGISTFTVNTGAVLDSYTKFLIMRARVYVNGLPGTNSIDLDPSDPTVWQHWRDCGTAFVVARVSHYIFDVPGFLDRPVQTGLLLDTATAYDISSLLPVTPGMTISAVYLEMQMYGA